MLQKGLSQSGAVLFGLADLVDAELERALSDQNHDVHSHAFLMVDECVMLVEKFDADLVFCRAEPQGCSALLKALKQQKPGPPVIVVGHCPETSEWIGALEAGASDYCAPPFRPAELRWMLEAAKKPLQAAS
jgi:DNA-binding response OmpR family regulator